MPIGLTDVPSLSADGARTSRGQLRLESQRQRSLGQCGYRQPEGMSKPVLRVRPSRPSRSGAATQSTELEQVFSPSGVPKSVLDLGLGSLKVQESARAAIGYGTATSGVRLRIARCAPTLAGRDSTSSWCVRVTHLDVRNRRAARWQSFECDKWRFCVPAHSLTARLPATQLSANQEVRRA